MTDRKRDPLPEGYQFGDMGRDNVRPVRVYDGLTSRIEYRSESEWAALGGIVTANVIEAEEFASDAERHPVTEGFIAQRDLGDEA